MWRVISPRQHKTAQHKEKGNAMAPKIKQKLWLRIRGQHMEMAQQYPQCCKKPQTVNCSTRAGFSIFEWTRLKLQTQSIVHGGACW